MGKFSNNWKRRNGNFLGFRSIIDIVCALEILGVVLFLVAPQFVMNYLILNPAAILHGQIWRIVTFLVYPPAITGSDAIMFVLMNALGIYCIRAFGTIVEQVWGRFRFNCYIIGGVLLHSVVAIGIYLVTGLSLPLFPTYLVYSFFICICPDVSGYAGTVYDGTAIKGKLDRSGRGRNLYLFLYYRRTDREDRDRFKSDPYWRILWLDDLCRSFRF